MKLKLMLSIIVVFAFLSFSCKSGSSIEPYTIGYLSIDYSSIEPVYEVDFGSDDELEITLSGTFSNVDMFLVKMNSNNSVINSIDAGYVKSENIAEPLMLGDFRMVPESQSTLSLKKDHIASMDFLNLYQPQEESGILVPSRSIVPGREELVDYGDGDTYSEGDTKTFWVENASGVFIEITAVLKVEGYYSYVWVPVINFDDNSTLDNDNKLTQDQLTSLANKFDGTGPSYDDGIYELVTNVFGFEYGGGAGGNGGKDEDKHVSILIYDINYDYSSSQTGGVFGYFWGKDYYDDSYTSVNWNLRSNESEIFYIDSHFLDRYPSDIYSTLAHEFQHMIHFNRKFIENGLYSATWYNEMLSMLAEDIMQDKLGNLDSASPKARTNEFVDGYFLSGVTDWLSGNDVYYSYASAFMFGAFMTRNFGGPELIEAMIDSNSVNQSSVTDALASVGYGTESFDSVFDKYHTALIYSTEDLPDDILVTNVSSSATINSVTYNQTGFDIYSYNNFSSYAGPVLFLADYKLTLRPLGMSIHSDNAWLGLSGDQLLNFNIVAPAAGVKYYLMFR